MITRPSPDHLGLPEGDLAAPRHPVLGDIRGSGLVWGIEVVTNKLENLPVGSPPSHPDPDPS